MQAARKCALNREIKLSAARECRLLSVDRDYRRLAHHLGPTRRLSHVKPRERLIGNDGRRALEAA